ncbi:hypothetical protein BO82DRAFT_408106 [Aspergillus uvarum CBS 121591]|uniref:Uncharacterized protein n=1 Tax=Aspergillus uvarum CBS 121591 TaxID=1448315 RepID=A0A319BS11_9EURO|nr:hypothetical protein BO82DRAFT_408106 [Aspergillus uvarum CBS 121591]PYH75314.1 hypothetical protein BO82DRAFT_408106 [Aspergillus uvarum CBS 121591]
MRPGRSPVSPDTGPHAGDPGRPPGRALSGCGIRASGGGSDRAGTLANSGYRAAAPPGDLLKERWPAANDPQTPAVPGGVEAPGVRLPWGTASPPAGGGSAVARGRRAPAHWPANPPGSGHSREQRVGQLADRPANWRIPPANWPDRPPQPFPRETVVVDIYIPPDTPNPPQNPANWPIAPANWRIVRAPKRPQPQAR